MFPFPPPSQCSLWYWQCHICVDTYETFEERNNIEALVKRHKMDRAEADSAIRQLANRAAEDKRANELEENALAAESR